MLMDSKFLFFRGYACLRPFWLLGGLLVGVLAAHLNALRDLFVTQFVKNTITSQCNEIVLFSYLKAVDVGDGHDHVGVATTVVKLCFWIAKCPTD